jgi:ribosomal protein S27AE
MPKGYPRPIASYIEDRTLNRIETPDDLLVDIAAALTESHGTAALEYEHKYIDIHHPTRQCPNCGAVIQMQVVVNRDTDTRTRECTDCGVLPADGHIAPESRQAKRFYQQQRRLSPHNDRRLHESLEVVA